MARSWAVLDQRLAEKALREDHRLEGFHSGEPSLDEWRVRLAVDTDAQGDGLGVALLRHAMELTVAASNTIGVRLLVVNALHDRAADFYRRFGFEPSPTNPLDLMITVNDIVASM